LSDGRKGGREGGRREEKKAGRIRGGRLKLLIDPGSTKQVTLKSEKIN
jgi:hypothetical protein